MKHTILERMASQDQTYKQYRTRYEHSQRCLALLAI